MMKFLFNLLPIGFIAFILENSDAPHIKLTTEEGKMKLFLTHYYGIAIYPDMKKKELLKDKLHQANKNLENVINEINTLPGSDIEEILKSK